jgi:hypothetical protein
MFDVYVELEAGAYTQGEIKRCDLTWYVCRLAGTAEGVEDGPTANIST